MLHTRHTAGQVVQRLLESSPASPSNQVSFCMSTWHCQQGPSLWIPLRLYTLAAEKVKPFPTPQRSLPCQSGAHSFPRYKSILRNLASDKEILCVRILPVPRSFKTELLFSLIQGTMNQPVDYLLCLLIYVKNFFAQNFWKWWEAGRIVGHCLVVSESRAAQYRAAPWCSHWSPLFILENEAEW